MTDNETILTGAPEETPPEQTQPQTQAEETPPEQTQTPPENKPEETPSYTVPESADGYEFTGEIPEGMGLDEEQMSDFRKFAHENKVPKEVFSKMVEYDLARARKMSEAWRAQYENCESTLKKEWGGDYDRKLAQCNKFLTAFGFADILKGNSALNDPAFIMRLSELGAKISESKLKDGEAVQRTDPSARIREITGDTNGAYWDEKNPGHAAAVAEVVRLTGMIQNNKQNRA